MPSPCAVVPAIDPNVLAAYLGDDRDSIRTVLLKFRESALESEALIAAAWRCTDLVALAAGAHRLAGSADAVGAKALGAVAHGLERAGKAADRDGCRSGIDRLGRELQRALAEIPGEPG